MWCDNCLLILPLRSGGMAWAFLIAVYSIAGGVFLLIDGKFLFFHYPEWSIYGGIGVLAGLTALINLLAFGNKSYIWTRVVKFLWPFVIVISAIRAIAMIVELQGGKDNFTWECNNGGQMWPGNLASAGPTTSTLPTTFCTAGFASLNAAFIICLLVDLACQIYMFFLTWRYLARLEDSYSDMKAYDGGYYSA